MELMEVLKHRRAIREFAGKTVDRAVVERLVDAAVLAPSAMNLQPWLFAVLLSPERIDEYADRAKRWLLTSSGTAWHGEAARKILEKPDFDIFYHAPALVLVMAESSATQAIEDCCLAAQNLMLAARDEGLGTCWIGFARPWLNLPETKRELGVAQECEIVAPIVLGYPRSWPETHGREQPKIHWM